MCWWLFRCMYFINSGFDADDDDDDHNDDDD